MPLCILHLTETYSAWRKFLEEAFSREFVEDFRAYCASPRASCVYEHVWSRYVERIEGMGYAEYWKKHSMREHIQISDRWVTGCGLLTRVYLRRDGAIVFSHSEHGYSGVHVLYPVKHIRKYIADRIREISGGGVWW